MTQETTYDADGQVTAIHVVPQKYTISYGRKVPRDGGFGANEEAALHVQVDVSADDTDEEIDNKVAAAFARAKGHVFAQLGLDFVVSPEGVVVGSEVESKSAAPKKAGGARKATGAPRKGTGKPRGGGNADKSAAWDHLLENPDDFWDNRDKKESGQYKPNASDFKGKEGTAFADVSLWLDTAPDDVLLAYGLDAEAA